jgi:hypothetical protein
MPNERAFVLYLKQQKYIFLAVNCSIIAQCSQAGGGFQRINVQNSRRGKVIRLTARVRSLNLKNKSGREELTFPAHQRGTSRKMSRG